MYIFTIHNIWVGVLTDPSRYCIIDLVGGWSASKVFYV